MILKIIALITIILFLGINAAFAQHAIAWGEEIIVADGATYGNVRPRIAVNGDGEPIVLFGKAPAGILYAAKWNGTSFDTPVNILPPTMETYLSYWTGPDIDALGDTVIAVFKAMPYETGKVYAVRSIDGGITYSDTVRMDSYATEMAWMPSIDLTDEGNPIVTYMVHDAGSTNPRYVYNNSMDAGLTFGTEVEIASSIPGEACDCCPAEVVASGNQQVVLFRNNDSDIRDMHAVYSGDNGANFDSYENVDQMNWSFNSCPSTGPDGHFLNADLYAISASRASGQFRVHVSRNTTSGPITYAERLAIAPPPTTYGKQNYPRIAGDDQLMVITWAEAESSNYEIYTAVSTDGTLSEFNTSKQMVNNAILGAQNYPDIAYQNGIFHIVYQDLNVGAVVYKRGVLSSVGTAENNSTEFKVYPNPVIAGNSIIVSGDDLQDAKIECFSMLGQAIPIASSYANGQLNIDLGGVPSGNYILKVNAKEYSLQIQIVD